MSRAPRDPAETRRRARHRQNYILARRELGHGMADRCVALCHRVSRRVELPAARWACDRDQAVPVLDPDALQRYGGDPDAAAALLCLPRARAEAVALEGVSFDPRSPFAADTARRSHATNFMHAARSLGDVMVRACRAACYRAYLALALDPEDGPLDYHATEAILAPGTLEAHGGDPEAVARLRELESRYPDQARAVAREGAALEPTDVRNRRAREARERRAPTTDSGP